MILKNYLESIEKEHQTGVAREHAYRPALKTLLEASLAHVTAVNDPVQIPAGAPDFILKEDPANLDLGYLEAKDLAVNLDAVEKSEQLMRYRAALENLILTNSLEFRLYRHSERVQTVAIAHLEHGKIIRQPENFPKLAALLREFGAYQAHPIQSPEALAEIMAQKALLMNNVFLQVLIQKEPSTLKDQHEAFKEVLLHNMPEKQFADVYAQTIAYGMFIARLHHDNTQHFSRAVSLLGIPRSNPFLRSLFEYVAGANLEKQVVWTVDALCMAFNAVDLPAILKDFDRHTGFNNPVLHFYETFLTAYDPDLKKKRGVFYTPEPVVGFIIRSLDEILKTRFHLKEGLAYAGKTPITVDKKETSVHKVQLLDMAAGTGKFMTAAIEHIHHSLQDQRGIWPSYVETDLLPRLHGFELLMAPYAMCHLTVDMLLKKTGYDLEQAQPEKRVGVYLTSALEEYYEEAHLPFVPWLAQEANAASHIKRDLPLMVIFGNPPYRGESMNRNDHIDSLMQAYKKEPDGRQIQEKNSKWINNDYVKFMRVAENFIQKNGEGVLGFITSHAYLDGPIFRGMRWHLLQTFDEIYVLDLHGNSRKKERTPQGGKDQNVFDIQEGVAIFIGIKTPSPEKTQDLAKVYHADLWGLRQEKYDFLNRHSLDSVRWQPLSHHTPYYFFIPKNYDLLEEYERGFALHDLFLVKGTGIITKRDHLTIHQTKEKLWETIQFFLENPEHDVRRILKLPPDVRDWKFEWAKKDLRGPSKNNIQKISYRPFDTRYFYYTGRARGFIGWPVEKISKHMLQGENLALNVARQQKSSNFQHVFCHRQIAESALVSNKTSEISYTMPLYLYDENVGQKSNLAPALFSKIQEQVPQITPESLFDYIYAVLHSRPYRQRYGEFLKSDFPRIPFPAAGEFFDTLVEKGKVLRELHLLEGHHFEERVTTYPVLGNQRVEKVFFQKETAGASHGRVYINSTQYFGNVSQGAWEFYIGGYQPAQQWLKDRKGQQLDFAQVKHYQRIVQALQRTEEVMEEIEGLAFLPQ